jgi:predicted secreted Zn-dependent protease
LRKSLTVWLCVLILGTLVTAARQSGDADRAGTWSGTWEGAGQTGGFELTLQKSEKGPLTGGVSVTGEPTYKVTLETVTIEGDKLNAVYDFPAADGAEVVLAGTFDGTTCKGTWLLREKASGTAAVDGTWSVTKK